MSDPIKIKIKRGLTAGNAPSVLSFGELAVNTFDRTLFVGGVTGGVQDYPLQKTYVYNTYTDFVADIDAGIYGTAGDESHFQYGDLFIERNTRFQYGFLPSTTGPTSVGAWSALTVNQNNFEPEGIVGDYVVSFNGLTGEVTSPTSIDSLTDVVVGSKINNDLLSWNSATSKWINRGVGISAGNFIILGSGGTAGTGKLPAVDGSLLLEVNARYLDGKIREQITDGGVF